MLTRVTAVFYHFSQRFSCRPTSHLLSEVCVSGAGRSTPQTIQTLYMLIFFCTLQGVISADGPFSPVFNSYLPVMAGTEIQRCCEPAFTGMTWCCPTGINRSEVWHSRVELAVASGAVWSLRTQGSTWGSPSLMRLVTGRATLCFQDACRPP